MEVVPDLVLKEECYVILGACFEVYTVMGCGFLEAVYHECQFKEFLIRDIPFCSRPMLHLHYKDQVLEQSYQPDFICFNHIILQLKATANLIPCH